MLFGKKNLGTQASFFLQKRDKIYIVIKVKVDVEIEWLKWCFWKYSDQSIEMVIIEWPFVKSYLNEIDLIIIQNSKGWIYRAKCHVIHPELSCGAKMMELGFWSAKILCYLIRVGKGSKQVEEYSRIKQKSWS